MADTPHGPDAPERQRPTARDRVVTTITLPPDVLAALDGEAAREDRSRTWLVEEIIRAALGLPSQRGGRK